MPTISERIEEWESKHGGRKESIVAGSWRYYPDGACRELCPGGGVMISPTDDHERKKNVVIYWRTKLEKATHEFREFKQKILQAGGGVYVSRNDGSGLNDYLTGDEARQRLQIMMQEVKACTVTLADVEEDYNGPVQQTGPAVSSAKEDFLNEIRSMEV